MKIDKFYVFQYISIILWGFVIFNIPTFKALQIFLFLVSAFVLCYMFEVRIQENHRFKNYPKAILYFYIPSLIIISFYILSFNMQFDFFAIQILHVLALGLVYFLVRKNLYIPYLLVVSELSFLKARKLSHQVYEKQIKKSKNYVDTMILLGICLAGIQSLQMLFVSKIDINVLLVMPFFLLSSYAKLCKNIKIEGNTKSKGKFSVFYFVLSMALLVLALIGDPRFRFSSQLDASIIKEEKIGKYQFEIGILEADYEDFMVQLKKAEPSTEAEIILSEMNIEKLPIDYEVYFVNSVSDKSKEGEYIVGLTIMQKNKAISYVSLPKEAYEIHGLKHVLYHEYCHVLLLKMEDKRLETLKNNFQKLDPDTYLINRSEEEMKKYYVSTYATTDVIEDMCDVFGVYYSNPSLLETNEVYKQKRDYLLEALGGQYEKNFYH